jgi:hypothetical protein|tara:strand:+ start:118 stop:603 length:486 start_codon:yes stop_codon:yes gene_type:complete
MDEQINRYMIIIIGNSKGIEKDLNNIADRDHGIDFVDSKVIFLGTFFSPYTTTEIHEKLVHRPAFLLFDISDNEDYAVNLPAKYYTGLFPEAKKIMDELYEEENKPSTKRGMSNAKSKVGTKSKKVEEYTSINDILDKLSRNDYDTKCLTEKEKEILDSQK